MKIDLDFCISKLSIVCWEIILSCRNSWSNEILYYIVSGYFFLKDEVAALALANVLVDSSQIGCEPDTQDGETVTEPVASQSG